MISTDEKRHEFSKKTRDLRGSNKLLHHFLKKQFESPLSKQGFVPFVNERDGLGRILSDSKADLHNTQANKNRSRSNMRLVSRSAHNLPKALLPNPVLSLLFTKKKGQTSERINLPKINLRKNDMFGQSRNTRISTYISLANIRRETIEKCKLERSRSKKGNQSERVSPLKYFNCSDNGNEKPFQLKKPFAAFMGKSKREDWLCAASKNVPYYKKDRSVKAAEAYLKLKDNSPEPPDFSKYLGRHKKGCDPDSKYQFSHLTRGQLSNGCRYSENKVLTLQNLVEYLRKTKAVYMQGQKRVLELAKKVEFSLHKVNNSLEQNNYNH